MSEDRYRNLRELPFDAIARALDFDFSRFKSRKGGAEHAGPCPIHRPKKNATSFSYSTDGKWNCFSCNERGRGAIDLVIAVRRIGFQEAVTLLEPYGGNAILEDARRKVRKPEIRIAQETPTQNEPFKSTYEKFKVESAWLKNRGLEPATLERYGVFEYRNDARRSAYNGSVLIRISRYSDGETVAYLSRNIGEVTPEEPKYRFPANFHKSLEVFGAWQLKEQSPIRVLYVAESPFSVMHFHQLGLPAVALFGWAPSPQQIEIVTSMAKGILFPPTLPVTRQRGQSSEVHAFRLPLGVSPVLSSTAWNVSTIVSNPYTCPARYPTTGHLFHGT